MILNYKKWKHAFINAPFIFTNIPGQFLLGLAFVKIISWTSFHQFGFLYHLNFGNSSLFMFIVAFIFLDLGEYVYHVIMHKVKKLWAFHLVHHSDNVVDVSTTLREHPVEGIIRLTFTLLWVFVSGTLFWVLIVRQIIQAFTTLFAHMNLRIPEYTDSIIGLIFITPNLHQVHHHYKQPYTDCNYGDVLSIWDRLFGTFKRLPKEELVFGIDTHMKEEDLSFRSL
ncbi:MAG: sterol desaturase family protein, partial [Bacteroidota bacterium]|nr:sterol desaturase family protein [Bacteroidota bacterium]